MCAEHVRRGRAPTATDTGSVTALGLFGRRTVSEGMSRGLPGAPSRIRLQVAGLMSRCLLPDPRGHADWPCATEAGHGLGGGADRRLLRGPRAGCVDASGACPTDPLLNRVGWGAVQVGGSFGGQILGAVRGTLNHPLQEVGMGEILVVAEMLRFCIPPITIVTDYQNLVYGLYTLGPGGTTSSGCRYADVWRLFWLAISDFGRDLVTVVKVPSHRTLEAFVASPGTLVADWHGNRQADLAAKRGAAMHGGSVS